MITVARNTKILIFGIAGLVLVGASVAWRVSHFWNGAAFMRPPAPIFTKITPIPLPEDNKATIPVDASSEQKEFLENRAILMNNFARCHNQMLKSSADGTNAGTSQDLEKLFHEQNEALLQKQAQLSQVIAKQKILKPLPTPPPLQIPPQATPQMKAYLIARDKLNRDQIQTLNRYRTADPKAREIAMQQWQQQNAARLQELRQLAQAIIKTNKT